MTQKIFLREIAYGRSGDKGSSANIGIIAYTAEGYEFLKAALSAEAVQHFFLPLGVTRTIRYELPNIGAFNFVLENILGGGGSLSLRIDGQGKALAQALLEMEIEVDPVVRAINAGGSHELS